MRTNFGENGVSSGPPTTSSKDESNIVLPITMNVED